MQVCKFFLSSHEICVPLQPIKNFVQVRRYLYIILPIVCLLLGLFGWLASRYYFSRVCNFRSMDGEMHGYYVYPGASVDSVLALVMADYEVLSLSSFRSECERQQAKTFKEGYYRLPAQLGSRSLVYRMRTGAQTPVRLSFNRNIRTNQQLASRLSKQLLLDSTVIVTKLESSDYMAQYGLTPQTALCLFLPNTYEVYWSMSVDALFERFHREYTKFWSEERLAKAKAMGLTPPEVYTLASIVASETNRVDEHATIAGLYINRLRKGMLLQACPTAVYASGNFALKRVLKKHIEFDSPYNTYKYLGLPPGPIRCVEASVLDSVLHYKPSKYLYMCANPDFSGTHVFSSTYAEHSAVARRYQRALNQRRIR